MLDSGRPGHVVNGLDGGPARLPEHRVLRRRQARRGGHVPVDVPRAATRPWGCRCSVPASSRPTSTPATENRPGTDGHRPEATVRNGPRQAMTPAEVARCVVEAVEADRFWICPRSLRGAGPGPRPHPHRRCAARAAPSPVRAKGSNGTGGGSPRRRQHAGLAGVETDRVGGAAVGPFLEARRGSRRSARAASMWPGSRGRAPGRGSCAACRCRSLPYRRLTLTRLPDSALAQSNVKPLSAHLDAL